MDIVCFVHLWLFQHNYYKMHDDRSWWWLPSRGLCKTYIGQFLLVCLVLPLLLGTIAWSLSPSHHWYPPGWFVGYFWKLSPSLKVLVKCLSSLNWQSWVIISSLGFATLKYSKFLWFSIRLPVLGPAQSRLISYQFKAL